MFPGALLLVAGWLLPAICFALPEAGKTDPITVQHADRFESSREGEVVTIFMGNVSIVHDGTTITCERAVYYEQEGRVSLEENVSVVKAMRAIRADRIEYEERRQLLVGQGDSVWITDDEAHLVATAGQIHYDLDAEEGFLTMGPFLRQERADHSLEATLAGDTVFVFSREKRALARGDSVRLWYEQDRLDLTGTAISYEYGGRRGLATGRPMIHKYNEFGDTLFTVLCDTAEVLMEEDLFMAHGAVRIIRESLVADGARASFHNEKRQILLTGQPVLRQGRQHLSGDSLQLCLDEWMVTDILSFGHSRIVSISPQDSLGPPALPNELSGRQMRLYLAAEEAESLVVAGNASSIYHIEEAERKGARNEASGDTIVLYFSSGEMARTIVRGGARGAYITPAADQGASPDTVSYEASGIDYAIGEQTISWVGQSRITYRDIVLTAGHVAYDMETDLLSAEGIPDSSGSLTETPVLHDGAQETKGTWLEYNLKTQKGKITQGSTQLEKGYYTGQSVRKVADKVLSIDRGSYTTCDLDNPHYHFYTRRMKVYQNDKVIAKPVVLYFGKVPVAILPFAIFPIKKGRHSGLLIPRYGNTDTDGRYLRDAGYYYAPSDYWDALGKVSLYEKTGWMLESRLQYALRYQFSGSVGGSYRWDRRLSSSGETKSKRWNVRFNHNHTIGPSLTAKASGEFISDTDYFQDVSESARERMERILRSELVLDQRWEAGSLSLRLYNERNLDTDRTTQYLPSLTFRKPQSPIFRTPVTGGQTKEERRWYHSLYYSYNALAVNWRQKQGGTWEEHAGLDHRLSFSASQTMAGWLGFSPRLDLRETWFDEDKEGHHGVRRGSYEAAVSSNATLYGLFQPGIGPLSMVRHKLQPRLQYSYRPDISNADRYYSFGGISGPGGSQSSLSFGVGNYFQGKTLGSQGEKKFDIATLDFSAGYNFKATGQKFSALSSALRVFPSKLINLDFNASHSLYDLETGKFKPWRPDLRSMSLTTTLRLQPAGRSALGDRDGAAEFGLTGESLSQSGSLLAAGGGVSPGGGKWELALSHYYSLTRSSSENETQWLDIRVGWSFNRDWFPLSTGWTFSYAAKLDMERSLDTEKSRFISQQLIIHKDLHCWEAQFVWIPTGGREGYYFRINVKMLPELKIERSRGISGTGF